MDELHKNANLLPLKYRREEHLLNYMFDQAQNQSLAKPKARITTRSQKKKLLKTKRPYTEKFKKCLAYVSPKKWNSLPLEFHSPHTKSSFKTLTKCRATCKALAAAVLDKSDVTGNSYYY